MIAPLGIDLFAGLGGWTEGLLAEGFCVVGFDIERHIYGDHRYPAQLVLQDVRTLHGHQFANASLIVASPPCQAYSYRAMPWKRAKALPPPDNTLFETCFRLQAEACEAAGRHIPLVVENVCGAQKWVGRARWHYGSYYLWGDVPALMPIPLKMGVKVGRLDWSKYGQPDYKSSGAADCFRDAAIKNAGGSWFRVAHNTTSGHSRNPDGRLERQDPRDQIRSTPHMTNPHEHDRGVKGFHGQRLGEKQMGRRYGGKSSKRKAASAMIARIPFPLARWIAHVYKPREEVAA